MKRSVKEINARRDAIFQELLKKPEIKVNELAELFKVSELTIRRDLLYFEQKNLIERYYGGASILHYSVPKEISKDYEMIKNRLAKKAADYIDSGDTVFINTSSTAIRVLKYLKNKTVTIVTNNGNALLSQYDENITVILTGGELHPPKDTMTGDFALATLAQIRANKAIIGCSGVSLNGGITTSVHREVSVNQMMIKNCKGPIIVLADHSKLNSEATYSSGSLNDVHYLITDEFADDEVIEEIETQTSLHVVLVPIRRLITKS